ncbi:MAG TPA: hypothetical protein VFX43_10590 [Chitinophagaceae bacterium]|nr:hypothetical protein [Chitinophagaceae bacterium]
MPCLILVAFHCQAQHRVSSYLWFHANKTLYDRTIGNNPGGAGLAAEALLHTGTKFKPSLELTGDVNIGDDKVLRYGPDGKPLETVNSLSMLMAGSAFYLTNHIFLSFLLGPAFLHQRVLFGLSPSAGFFFSKTQRLACKLSYVHIFHRELTSLDDFGMFSLGIGIKLF